MQPYNTQRIKRSYLSLLVHFLSGSILLRLFLLIALGLLAARPL